MEFVEGGDIASLIKNVGALPVELARCVHMCVHNTYVSMFPCKGFHISKLFVIKD